MSYNFWSHCPIVGIILGRFPPFLEMTKLIPTQALPSAISPSGSLFPPDVLMVGSPLKSQLRCHHL